MKNLAQPRILVVDDEKSVRRFLKVTLNSGGFNVCEASDGTQGLEKTISFRPDVVVLDLGLPDRDGVEVIHELRKRSRIPIVIISVREQINDKLEAFEAGADDYLTKPFDPQEIKARLNAVMRRLIPADREELISIGNLQIDLAKRHVRVKGLPVALTPKEYDVLKLLVSARGAVLTHKHLLMEVWARDNNLLKKDFHMVRVTIKNLRNKIEPNPSKPVYILSILGVGYRIADH